MMYNITKLSGEQQGQESFQLTHSDGRADVLKTWDYASLYAYPNLYEQLFCDLLKLKVHSALWECVSKVTQEVNTLRVLDVACGSGLMGRYLKQQCAEKIDLLIGVDTLQEAIEALQRDNPGLYDTTYIVNETLVEQLKQHGGFNCLIVSGGASHLELEDYQQYRALLSEQAYIAFHLRCQKEDSKRTDILEWMNNNFHLHSSQVYTHRELMNGDTVQHEAFLYEV